MLAKNVHQRKKVRGIPSKSLKLLPILGLPSLPSRPNPFPFAPGLLPASSTVRFGLNGPGPVCLFGPGPGLVAGAAELALESEVWDTSVFL